jgi:hypothetical protein
MRILLGFILVAISTVLAAIHFYWGIGGKWGATGAVPTKRGGEKVLQPGSFDCFVVGLGLLCFGLLVLVKAGILQINLPRWLADYGVWLISAIFILRSVGEFKYVGFFKKIRDTTFGKLDTKYFSPLCLLIGLLGTILSLLK